MPSRQLMSLSVQVNTTILSGKKIESGIRSGVVVLLLVIGALLLRPPIGAHNLLPLAIFHEKI